MTTPWVLVLVALSGGATATATPAPAPAPHPVVPSAVVPSAVPSVLPSPSPLTSAGGFPSAVAHASGPSALHQIFDGFTWTQGAVIIAALIAAIGVAATILTTSARARRDRLADLYAEALSAVSEYNEGPYRIRRRTNGNAEHRFAITSALSDVKARIEHCQNMLHLHAPAGVAAAYDAYVTAARREAGQQMHEAWKSPGIENDTDVNLHEPFSRAGSEPLRVHVVAVMQADLDRRTLKPWTRLSYRRSVNAATTATRSVLQAGQPAAPADDRPGVRSVPG